MSVCGQSGQAEEDSATEEVTPAAASATRDIYKQKPASKVVRVLTVLAYLLSVSLAAILLSVYYICVWRSPELPLDLGEGEASARLGNRTHYQRHHHLGHHHKLHAEYAASPTGNYYGGGDTTVNGDIIHSTPENITGGFTDDNVTEPSSEAAPSATAPPATTPGLNGSSAFSNDTDSVT